MRYGGFSPLHYGLGLAAVMISLATVWGAYAAALPVLVTIPPQAELVERVGGDRVKVQVLVPPGQDPHTFLPKPRQMVELARAKLYFRTGVPIEQRLVGKLRRGSDIRVVDTTEGVERRAVDDHRHHGEHGEHVHRHGHAAPDPHVWLSPPLLVKQAGNIAEALMESDPQGSRQYRANFRRVADRLEALDADIREQLAPYKGRAFYVFHPALGYFAEAYGLEQKAVEISGRSPTPGELRRLISQAKRDRIDTLFVQPQFDQRAARAVARAIGAELVTVDPLRRDLFENLREMAEKVAESMEAAAPADR